MTSVLVLAADRATAVAAIGGRSLALPQDSSALVWPLRTLSTLFSTSDAKRGANAKSTPYGNFLSAAWTWQSMPTRSRGEARVSANRRASDFTAIPVIAFRAGTHAKMLFGGEPTPTGKAAAEIEEVLAEITAVAHSLGESRRLAEEIEAVEVDDALRAKLNEDLIKLDRQMVIFLMLAHDEVSPAGRAEHPI